MYFFMWNKWPFTTQIEADAARDIDHVWERSTEHVKYKYWYHRTVNYCLLCYVVFWIPTVQDTIFSFQQKQYNSDSINNFTEIFNRRFSEEKQRNSPTKSMLNTTRWQFWLSIFRTFSYTFWPVFCLFPFNAKRSYKLQTAHWDWTQQENKKTLGICT